MWVSFVFVLFLSLGDFLKQNEENKRKNKRAALKAQMDLEEARKTAQEQQRNNNASLQGQEGESFEFKY